MPESNLSILKRVYRSKLAALEAAKAAERVTLAAQRAATDALQRAQRDTVAAAAEVGVAKSRLVSEAVR